MAREAGAAVFLGVLRGQEDGLQLSSSVLRWYRVSGHLAHFPLAPRILAGGTCGCSVYTEITSRLRPDLTPKFYDAPL